MRLDGRAAVKPFVVRLNRHRMVELDDINAASSEFDHRRLSWSTCR
jgi:hypothetical protein